VRTAVDLFRSGCCTTKKWHGYIPSQLHSVSRPASWAGFPIPSARLARTPGGWTGHGACVEGSPSLLRAPEQARAVAAFNPTQHQSPAAGRRAAGARGGRAARGVRGCVCVCAVGRKTNAAASPRYLLFHITAVRVLNICGCAQRSRPRGGQQVGRWAQSK
jgi:hypothetical protein